MTARLLAVVLLVAPCDNTFLWEPFELLESARSMEEEIFFGEHACPSAAGVVPSTTRLRSPYYALGKAEQVLTYKSKRLKDNQRITRKMVAEAGTVSTTPVQTSSTHHNRAETTSAVTSVPGMIHFMVTHDFQEYCEAQVYGSIPSVIQILINGDVKDGRKHYITFNFIGNGGDMRFDAPGGTDAKTARNLLHVLKTLTSVVITGRPWSNKFPEFHRSSHMLANQQLAERKREYRYKGISVQHQTFTIIPLLVYATLVAFVLTIPFSRREIKYDNVRIQDEPQDMSATPKKKSKESAQTPPTPSTGQKKSKENAQTPPTPSVGQKKSKENAQTPPTPSVGQKVSPAQTPSAEPDGKPAHPYKNLKSVEREENKPSKEKDEEVLLFARRTCFKRGIQGYYHQVSYQFIIGHWYLWWNIFDIQVKYFPFTSTILIWESCARSGEGSTLTTLPTFYSTPRNWL